MSQTTAIEAVSLAEATDEDEGFDALPATGGVATTATMPLREAQLETQEAALRTGRQRPFRLFQHSKQSA